jgi:ubiquinone biosynthesis protein Coq4
VAEGHYKQARLDIVRRQWAIRKIRSMAETDGVAVYFKAVLGMLRVVEDRAMTERYRALGELPEGTLGRAYFEYIMSNEFLFPGERGAPPEAIVFHDMTHILSGYGTTPSGEILAATFSAGYSHVEVLNWLMFVLCQFQLGLQTAPNVPTATKKLDPLELLVAFRRGAAVNQDLNDGWQYWDVIDQPVEALRERLNILPHAYFEP